jgi:hypothetical protein
MQNKVLIRLSSLCVAGEVSIEYGISVSGQDRYQQTALYWASVGGLAGRIPRRNSNNIAGALVCQAEGPNVCVWRVILIMPLTRRPA